MTLSIFGQSLPISKTIVATAIFDVNHSVNGLMICSFALDSVQLWNILTRLYLRISGALAGRVKQCPSFLLEKKYKVLQSGGWLLTQDYIVFPVMILHRKYSCFVLVLCSTIVCMLFPSPSVSLGSDQQG